MFKTLRTNRNEILTYGIGLILFFTLLYYGKTYFPPLAYVLSFGYHVMIAGLVFFMPWFAIRITLPHTLGAFVNDWFEAAWVAVGKPASFRISRSGRNIPSSEESMEEYRHAGELQQQLRITIFVYAILVMAGAFIAIAAFSQGISIPVVGNQ